MCARKVLLEAQQVVHYTCFYKETVTSCHVKHSPQSAANISADSILCTVPSSLNRRPLLIKLYLCTMLIIVHITVMQVDLIPVHLLVCWSQGYEMGLHAASCPP